MNKEIIYTNEPMELGEVVEDFLPSPEKLIPKKSKVKVTLELNEETIRFFKAEAKKQQTSYQEIISVLVNQYAQKK
ncbi:hypothetical protein [Cyanothece sp. BG0011]|uniref:hypothetical protein n=1 Tax=Cyanothece sp. BG0011 TaxID=2082950 RepID=UPI0018E56D76|nr:hypothetical protein [Cyanothece sp. BG0011]